MYSTFFCLIQAITVSNGARPHQNVEDLIHIFPADLDAIDLQDLVSFMEESAALRRPALHDAADDHAVHVVPHGGALQAQWVSMATVSAKVT